MICLLSCILAQAVSVEHVLLSHGHVDHCGAVFKHARLRGRDLSPAKYYMHPAMIEPMLRYVLRLAAKLVSKGSRDSC
jgi:glyoxylase-like metal-dependent hydrolase (beta-lactamase superfamily II)